MTFVHDLKPYQILINKIRLDVDRTNEIAHVVKNGYNKAKLTALICTHVTFESVKLEVDLLSDTCHSVY